MCAPRGAPSRGRAGSRKGECHAGLCLELCFLGHGITVSFRDSRHWNYEKDAWYVYPEDNPKLIVSPDDGVLTMFKIGGVSIADLEIMLDDDLDARHDAWRESFQNRHTAPDFDLAAFNEEGRAIAHAFQPLFHNYVEGKNPMSYLRLLDTDGTTAASWQEEPLDV